MRHRNIKAALAASFVFMLVALCCGVALATSGPSLTPNDPRFSEEEPALRLAGLPQAWAVTLGSPSVIIAVVDSGVSPDPDLAPNLLPGYNAIDGSSNSADENGHGTGMAGIAAAAVNNGVGTSGACGNCRIQPVKVASANGHADADSMARGINWAASNGARVINLSRYNDPNTGPYPQIDNAISNAQARGVVVVIAAGNNARSDEASNTLASHHPEAVRVAAVDNDGKLAEFSNHGGLLADIAAPWNLVTPGSNSLQSGTSAATALVSGIVGLMLSYNPALTPADIKNILISSGTPEAGLDVSSGKVVNAYQALIGAGYKPPPPPPAKFSLRVAKRGSGTVTSRPAGINCGTACKASYPQGQQVKLTAKPKAGWKFSGWSGLCTGKKAVCSLSMNRSGVATATFVKAKK